MAATLYIMCNMGAASAQKRDRDTPKFELAAISLQEYRVQSQTSLNFQLQIQRTQPEISVEDGDYLIISLPEIDDRDSSADHHSSYWVTGGSPKCKMENGGKATSCQILSKRKAKITLAAQRNRIISGEISNFMTPFSDRLVYGISLDLVSGKTGDTKLYKDNLRLMNFATIDLDLKLDSSSKKIGATNQTLSMTFNKDIITPEGFIILHVPEYYYQAG